MKYPVIRKRQSPWTHSHHLKIFSSLQAVAVAVMALRPHNNVGSEAELGVAVTPIKRRRLTDGLTLPLELSHATLPLELKFSPAKLPVTLPLECEDDVLTDHDVQMWMMAHSGVRVTQKGNVSALPTTTKRVQETFARSDAVIPDGPTSYPEILKQADHMISRAQDREGWGWFARINLIENLSHHLEQGVVLTSDFSGCGPDSIAADAIADACPRLGIPLPADALGGMEMYASCDRMDVSQRVLCGQVGPHASKHVFGDLRSMIAPQIIRGLEIKLETLRSKIDKFYEACEPGEDARQKRKSMIKNEGVKFVKQTLRQGQHWSFTRNDLGWCLKCDQYCKRWPKASEKFHIATAGSTCTGFSSMGKGWGWLDSSAIDCLIWARMMRRILPDAIVHECVTAFSETMLQQLLGPKYTVQSLVITPKDLGEPASRCRRFSVAVRTCQAEVVQLRPFDEDHFGLLAFRQIVADANVYFCASNDMIKQEYETMHAKNEKRTYSQFKKQEEGVTAERLNEAMKQESSHECEGADKMLSSDDDGCAEQTLSADDGVTWGGVSLASSAPVEPNTFANSLSRSKWRLQHGETCFRQGLLKSHWEYLEGYEKNAIPLIQARGCHPSFICNIGQTPEYSNEPISSFMPALLRRSSFIWRAAPHQVDDRMLTSWEFLAVQAMPAAPLLPEAHVAASGVSANIMKLLTPCSRKLLSGNAFNMSIFIKVVLFVLMTTRKSPDVSVS